jgi:hypothetical protein
MVLLALASIESIWFNVEMGYGIKPEKVLSLRIQK